MKLAAELTFWIRFDRDFRYLDNETSHSPPSLHSPAPAHLFLADLDILKSLDDIQDTSKQLLRCRHPPEGISWDL